MDSQAQLLVRDQESFLFLETPSRKLLLPSTRVQADEDFAAAAQRYINEVLPYNVRIYMLWLSFPYEAGSGGVLPKCFTVYAHLSTEAVHELCDSGSCESAASHGEGCQTDGETGGYFPGGETAGQTQPRDTECVFEMGVAVRAERIVDICDGHGREDTGAVCTQRGCRVPSIPRRVS